MPGTVSLGRTLVLATVLHAGLFAILSRAGASRSRATLIEPMRLVWVEAALEVEPTPPPRVQGAKESTPDPSTRPVAAPYERITPTAVPMASVVSLPESAPAASGGWSLHVVREHGTSAPSALTLAELGLDGKNHFLGDREATPDPEQVALDRGNRAAGEAMRAALHDGDVARGLGGSGPVITALEAAVLAGTAPFPSHAVLVAIADASGVITKVDVESFSDDPTSFRAIAEDVLNRLHDKRVRVPAGSHGLSMRIDVSALLALPSGGGIGLAPGRAAMSFDMSNVGSHVGRVVHARVLGEQLL
jgi:hypothetical protein